MKVYLVNGSPHEKGCTYTALREAADAIEAAGIETEVFWIGNKPLGGCIACGGCREKGKCVFDDAVNEFAELAKDGDGFIFGSPVHYAAISGNMTAFLDRLFFSGGMRSCRLKPGAAVLSARRAGTTAAFDQMIKYFTISEMPVVSSRYWNMVHGSTPEQVREDAEGLLTMRMLGRNMAYLLRCREAAEKAGIPLPEREPPVFTNFIR